MSLRLAQDPSQSLDALVVLASLETYVVAMRVGQEQQLQRL